VDKKSLTCRLLFVKWHKMRVFRIKDRLVTKKNAYLTEEGLIIKIIVSGANLIPAATDISFAGYQKYKISSLT